MREPSRISTAGITTTAAPVAERGAEQHADADRGEDRRRRDRRGEDEGDDQRGAGEQHGPPGRRRRDGRAGARPSPSSRKRSTIISAKPTPSASPVIDASATASGSVSITLPEQRHRAEAGERRDGAEARRARTRRPACAARSAAARRAAADGDQLRLARGGDRLVLAARGRASAWPVTWALDLTGDARWSTVRSICGCTVVDHRAAPCAATEATIIAAPGRGRSARPGSPRAPGGHHARVAALAQRDARAAGPWRSSWRAGPSSRIGTSTDGPNSDSESCLGARGLACPARR